MNEIVKELIIAVLVGIPFAVLTAIALYHAMRWCRRDYWTMRRIVRECRKKGMTDQEIWEELRHAF